MIFQEGSERGGIRDAIQLFLSNVHHARNSNDQDLSFANGDCYYHNSIRGLIKLAVAKMQRRWQKR
jgi:hypothetical protein